MDEDEFDEPYPDCPMCGGESGFMGWLGNLKWFRCLFCGMEFNVKEDKQDSFGQVWTGPNRIKIIRLGRLINYESL